MQIPRLCLLEKPTLGEWSCSSCPPPGQTVPSAAPALRVDGKRQPSAVARLVAPTRTKPAARSSALSHQPSRTKLSAPFVPVPVPSLTQCPFRTRCSERV